MNTEKVQGTNDSSIVSKLSMVNKGYFHDPYIVHFVEKSSRRSPLINRCYFARAAVISHCVEAFLKGCGSGNQIVSLGAGFDTTYFRMQEKNLLGSTHFVEIDFPDVITRKLALAARGGLFSEPCPTKNNPDHVFRRSENYTAIGFDLQLVGDELRRILVDVGVDVSKPTLFLSEVVLTYLPSKKSSNVIGWVADTFPHAMFTVFEQVTPDDSFGKVMIRHFNQIGSPLLTIHDYPTIRDQIQRHRNSGLKTTTATTLSRFYYRCINLEIRKKIESLEIFDEFEAWHRACQHYVVLCSTNSENDDIQNLVTRMFGGDLIGESAEIPVENASSIDCCNPVTNSDCMQRFGHCSCVTQLQGLEYAIVVGGFGVQSSKLSHQRLSDSILAVDLRSYQLHPCERSEDSHLLPCPMHATCVSSRNGQVLVFGGRSSPNKCTDMITEIQLFPCISGSWTYRSRIMSLSEQPRPKPRWRHAAAMVYSNSETECMVVFGGRDTTSVFYDMWIFDTEAAQWSMVDLPLDVSPRHSSSLTAMDDSTCVLCGGIGLEETPLDDIFTVKFEIGVRCVAVMSRLKMPMSPKIYSHSSIMCNGTLILCGGVTFNPHTRYGDEEVKDAIYVVNLREPTLARFELSCESPALLHNHSCVWSNDREEIVILGGGDNCFSFGTYFVKTPMTLKVEFKNSAMCD